MHGHDDHRRGFLVQMLAAGAASALPGLAHGGSVSRLQGDVRVNGAVADRTTIIKPGDTVATGRGASVAFVVADDAYLLRERSRLTLRTPDRVSTWLRLVSGALLAVFAPGPERTVSTPTVTAGVRGTGLYTAVRSARETYFCTCYGEIALRAAGGEQEIVRADHHAARTVTLDGRRGAVAPAPMAGHGDDELVLLESLVGRRPPFA